ncbi:hypothetical protein GCM10027589_51300 [Actinocorallia lasiicapitis]
MQVGVSPTPVSAESASFVFWAFAPDAYTWTSPLITSPGRAVGFGTDSTTNSSDAGGFDGLGFDGLGAGGGGAVSVGVGVAVLGSGVGVSDGGGGGGGVGVSDGGGGGVSVGASAGVDEAVSEVVGVGDGSSPYAGVAIPVSSVAAASAEPTLTYTPRYLRIFR